MTRVPLWVGMFEQLHALAFHIQIGLHVGERDPCLRVIRTPMCVHYVIEQPESVLKHAKGVADVFDLHGETLPANAWPRSLMPVVAKLDGRKTLTTMRWGVLAPFSKTAAGKPEYVANARDDSLLTKSIWKDAARHRRCLIPADGFHEWAGPAGAKYEVFFQLTGHRPFFFAGVWSCDASVHSFAIVTGRPNELVAAIPHNRVPVILETEGARNWLGDFALAENDIARLCAPYPASRMVRMSDTRKQDAPPL